jgi:hypothetical protein
MKTPSNIWLLAPSMLGNVFPSESIDQIVQLNFPRNPGHRCPNIQFVSSDKRRFAQKFLCSLRASTAPFQYKWGPPSGIDGGPT